MHVFSWRKINEPDIPLTKGESKMKKEGREEIKINVEFGDRK